MTMNCEMVKENIVSALGERFECMPVGHYLVVNTPFAYPNLDAVQVYIETFPNGDILLSDKGETLRYLASYLIDPDESEQKAKVMKTVTTAFGTEYKEGVFYKHSTESHFGEDILSMSNTILRVSDLQLAQKVRRPRSDFYQAVEELLSEIAPKKDDMDKRKTFDGNSGKKYHATYFIKKGKAIIEPLSHPLQAVDWTKVATVFQEFYDLKNNSALADHTLYAILDDEDNDWPEEPKILLSDVAKLLPWSRRHQWKDKIAA